MADLFADQPLRLPRDQRQQLVGYLAGEGMSAEMMEPVTTSAGVRIVPDTTFAEVATRAIDTLVVPSAVEVDDQRRVTALVDPAVVEWIRTLAPRTRR